MFEGPLQDLIDELSRLPGVGPKSAQRIAFHLLNVDPSDITRLQEALGGVRDGVNSAASAATFPAKKSVASAPTPDVTAEQSVSSKNQKTSKLSSAPANSPAATTSSAAPSTRWPTSAPANSTFPRSCSASAASCQTVSSQIPRLKISFRRHPHRPRSHPRNRPQHRRRSHRLIPRPPLERLPRSGNFPPRIRNATRRRPRIRRRTHSLPSIEWPPADLAPPLQAGF